MKIIHTSDLHLGHTLYGYDRTEEQAAMLAAIREAVEAHSPDVLVISGDVYHTSQPSATVQRMFAEAMVELRRTAPSMEIVVTAGNHDSGARHEVFREPWRALGVHAVGAVDRDNPDSHIIEIEGKGFVIAVPYAAPRNIPEDFFTRLTDIVAERNAGALPVVMMAHTAVAGSDFSGHDRATELTVGGIDAVSLDTFGSGYDYLALGHIHCPQFVDGRGGRARYSGSPLAVSFDEAYPHSLTLVELPARGAAPVTSLIEVPVVRPLVSLPAREFAPWAEARALLSDFPDDIPAYIRLNVEVDDFLPAGAREEAESLCAGKECRFCVINARRTAEASLSRAAMTVSEFRSASPAEIARMYAADTGLEFDDDLAAMFSEVIESVNEDSRQQ
ncbi:MAG: exonuclease subunit SbcD [Bacteroides sp.]|nr:exonuclease subunit SbcD [Bacteroides sp.]